MFECTKTMIDTFTKHQVAPWWDEIEFIIFYEQNTITKNFKKVFDKNVKKTTFYVKFDFFYEKRSFSSRKKSHFYKKECKCRNTLEKKCLFLPFYIFLTSKSVIYRVILGDHKRPCGQNFMWIKEEYPKFFYPLQKEPKKRIYMI